MNAPALDGVGVGREYAVEVTKLARQQQRADGQAAVALIEQAKAAQPAVGTEGQGANLRVYG